MKKKTRKIFGGAAAGACTGAAAGAGVAKYALVVDPTGITPMIVIGGFTLVGAIGGALGFSTKGSGDDDD